jgi:hypothetical protein
MLKAWDFSAESVMFGLIVFVCGSKCLMIYI